MWFWFLQRNFDFGQQFPHCHSGNEKPTKVFPERRKTERGNIEETSPNVLVGLPHSVHFASYLRHPRDDSMLRLRAKTFPGWERKTRRKHQLRFRCDPAARDIKSVSRAPLAFSRTILPQWEEEKKEKRLPKPFLWKGKPNEERKTIFLCFDTKFVRVNILHCFSAKRLQLRS